MSFSDFARSSYRGLPVLVTGGMGFIGSNLVIALVRAGACVTVVDAKIPGCGADPANLEDVEDQIRFSAEDMRNADKLKELIAGQEIIFNLAGEVSHVNSITDPLRDLSLNCAAQLQFLNLCRLRNPSATIVYASSRQVYGCPKYLPVDEEHPVNPVDFNGVHKHAAEQYHFLLRQQFQMKTICLRLGNIYGPRQAIDQNCRGFIDAFVNAALAGEPIKVFGDGRQLRGLLYVDDAVDVFLQAGLGGSRAAAVYNVGSPEPLPLLDIARTLSEITGGPSPRLVPFPPERLSIDIGSFYSTSAKFAHDFAWTPRVDLKAGFRQTLNFFQSRRTTPAHVHSHPLA